MSSRAAARSPWLLGPASDTLFLANGLWPALAAVAYFASPPVLASMVLARRFFFIQPHRWITLGLVFLDRGRFEQRRAAYLGAAALCSALFLGLWLATRQMLLILALDVVWNSWHGAAQHQGVSNIYAVQAAPEARRSGRWAGVFQRFFLFYCLCRIITVVTALPNLPYPAGVVAVFAAANPWLALLDYALALAAAVVFARELLPFNRALVGRYLHLSSVYAHHLLLLYAAHAGRMRLLLALGIVNGMFHSTEYMAMVTWSVQKRQGQAGAGVFKQLAREWGTALLVYVAFIGGGSWFLQERWFGLWLGLSTFVSYLHYTYDGMIWKRKTPVSAAHFASAPAAA